MSTPNARHIADDSFAAVVRSYLESAKFAKLAEGTQKNYRPLLNLASSPDILGAINVNVIRPALVQGFLDGLSAYPGKQKNALVTLKTVERFAVVRDLLPREITTGCEVIGGGDGHRPWTEQQIALAAQHARPHLACAIQLAAATGQRGSDLVKMLWTDLESDHGRLGINVVQRKTKLRIWLPFSNEFAAIIGTWERQPGPILRSPKGQPWSARTTFSKAWQRERDTNPELRVACCGLVMHGLRATACVRLRRLGATEAQISDMVGLSVPMVSRYCRFSVQRENATAAVILLDEHRENAARRQFKMVTG